MLNCQNLFVRSIFKDSPEDEFIQAWDGNKWISKSLYDITSSKGTSIVWSTGSASGTMSDMTYLNDVNPNTLSYGGSGSYTIITLPTSYRFHKWRQAGSGNAGDGLWDFQYYNLQLGSYKKWVSDIPTSTSTVWTQYISQTPIATDKVKIICKSVDSNTYSRISLMLTYDETAGNPYSGSFVSDGSFVCWYKMDEGTGTLLIDTVGSTAPNGTILNATWQNGQEEYGNCLAFNGTTAYVSYSNPQPPTLKFDGNQKFTISCWIKPQIGDTGLGIIIGRDLDDGANRAYFWGIHHELGSIYHMRAASASFVTPGPSLTDFGLWHHIVFAYDGTNMIAYLNGVCTGSITSTDAISVANANTPITIGKLSNGTNYLLGSIDDFRVWNNYCLNIAQVGSLYLGE